MPATPPSDMNKALFMELAIMLSSSAMQQLGKIINPMTGKTEIHLEAAQATIDMLEMLEAKTRGNLDREEERLIKNTLTALQMNYVETSASAQTAKITPEKPSEPPPTTPEKPSKPTPEA
ncbi:MAG: DUF1844 domain-containing protein [bacterium]